MFVWAIWGYADEAQTNAQVWEVRQMTKQKPKPLLGAMIREEGAGMERGGVLFFVVQEDTGLGGKRGGEVLIVP